MGEPVLLLVWIPVPGVCDPVNLCLSNLHCNGLLPTMWGGKSTCLSNLHCNGLLPTMWGGKSTCLKSPLVSCSRFDNYLNILLHE